MPWGVVPLKRPKFSLRDLLWLMVCCAMGFGWYASSKKIRSNAIDMMAEQYVSVKNNEHQLARLRLLAERSLMYEEVWKALEKEQSPQEIRKMIGELEHSRRNR